jgi:hypothetical protein
MKYLNPATSYSSMYGDRILPSALEGLTAKFISFESKRFVGLETSGVHPA